MRSVSQRLLESFNEIVTALDYHQLAEASIAAFHQAVNGDYYSVCYFHDGSHDLEVLHPDEGWLGVESGVFRALRFMQCNEPRTSLHPSMLAFMGNRKPSGFIRSLLMPNSQWWRAPHFQMVDRELGIRDMASIFLCLDDRRVMVLNCGRSRFFHDWELPSIERFERVMTTLLAGRATAMLSSQEHNMKHPTALLTNRELEVLHWVDEGKRNSEIALILSISSHTVRKHLENIFCKLGVETRSGAAKALES